MEVLLIIIIIVIIIHSLSFRKVKKDIVSLKKRISDIESPEIIQKNVDSTPVETPNLGVSTEEILSPESLPKLPAETVSPDKKKQWKTAVILLKRFEHIFIESWIAVIAVVILVAGISFFGIWASTRISPVFRFWIIVSSAILLGGLSVFAGRYKKFQPLAVWLRSAGAAVYLFAALGAGGIPGIQWIDSPLMGLLMLITGILVNIILAFVGKNQVFSSLHIILGVVAVSIAPQSVATLIVATIVTFSGITISFRKKWDIQHLISILFYFGFIIFWGFKVDPSSNFYNVSAVSAVIVTALITLFIHYLRIYADSGFEVTPLIVHLVNWLFLSIGLIKYFPETDYIYIPLFISGVLLFFLAGRAKKLKINWLFATDTLISQLMILLALISLINFDISNFLIIFLILAESLGFLIIIRREKEYLVHTVGFSISSLAAVALLFTGLERFGFDGSTQLWVYCGLFTLSAALMAVWLLYIDRRNTEIVFTGGRIKRKILANIHKANVNIQGTLVPIFILAVYLLILSSDIVSDYIGPDTFAAPLFIALLAVKFRLKNWGMRIGIAVYLVLESGISIIFAAFEVDSSLFTLIVYYLPILLMSLSLLVYSLKKQGGIHERIPGIYLLTVHLLFLSCFIFKDLSGLLTGLCWLLFAIIYLTLSNTLKPGKLAGHMTRRLKKGLINGGYLFLFSFVVRFLLFDIHEETIILGTIRAEYLLEITAFTVMGVWFFLNRSVRLLDLFFLEIALAFLIALLFIEVPVTILPAVFMVLSIVLLFIGRFFTKSLSRLRIVSVFPAWISAFLIAFVTSPYLTPSLSYTDTAWIMSAAAIILQFIYLALFHRTQIPGKGNLPDKLLKLEQPIRKLISGKNIFLYYPVFVSVLFFIIWSFNGAVLTALISFEALLILVLSILVKEDSFRYTALGGIIAVIIRLVFFDLREADFFIKAVAFIIVSVIMLLMNVLYNKFKDRIEEKAD